MTPFVTQGPVFQGTDALFVSRIRGITGAYIQRSDLTSVVITVYDVTDAYKVSYGPTTLTITSVVFNAIQPADGIIWTVDDVGYNFLCRVPGATAFPHAHDYRIDVIFTLTDGTHFPVQWDSSALPVP